MLGFLVAFAPGLAACGGSEEATNRDRLPRRNPTQQPAPPDTTDRATPGDDGSYQPAPIREGLFTSFGDYERQRDAARADLSDAIGTPAAQLARECKTIAVGEKACGGPRAYAVYSASGDAELRIIRLAARITALDREANEQFGLVSDCALVSEPLVVVEDGVCVAR